MKTLEIRQCGLAVGAVSSLLYFGCAITMLVLPDEMLIRFFNVLLHGLDVTPIMRHGIPWTDTILGVILWFVLGALMGAVFAAIYNLRAAKDA